MKQEKKKEKEKEIHWTEYKITNDSKYKSLEAIWQRGKRKANNSPAYLHPKQRSNNATEPFQTLIAINLLPHDYNCNRT